jgi:hypothetical protein
MFDSVEVYGEMDKDDIYFAVGTALALLGFFGLDWRWVKGRAPRASLTWRSLILVGALVGSLILCAVGWHKKLVVRERIVEKPVERIVERLVPQQCPKCVGQQPKITTPKRPAQSKDNSVRVDGEARISQQTTGPCSPNMIGGENTVNCGPPPLHLEYTFQTLPPDEAAYFSFNRAKCLVVTHMRIVPNQSVPPPVRVALDFDYPVTEIATTIENVGATEGGGPFAVGLHAVSAPISPGIGPSHALIVEVCSARKVNLIGDPHLVD